MIRKWLRPEYKGRENELETRQEFEKRTKISTESLASHFSRYWEKRPDVVCLEGKLTYFVAAELDDFIAWIAENSRKRSETDIVRSKIIRLEVRITEAKERVEARKREAAQVVASAEADLAKYAKQLKRAESDLKFLEHGE